MAAVLHVLHPPAFGNAPAGGVATQHGGYVPARKCSYQRNGRGFLEVCSFAIILRLCVSWLLLCTRPAMTQAHDAKNWTCRKNAGNSSNRPRGG